MCVGQGKVIMKAGFRKRNLLLLTAIIFLMLIGTACSDTGSPKNRIAESPIERNLREFYENLGGKSILGDFLSPVLQDGERYYQFTEKAVLVFDPQPSVLKQYYLHPVGLEMGFQEPPEPMPADPDVVYVNGYIVWPEALDLFNEWGRMCKPISALHYNEEYKRFEQYFDCFGVYRLEDEPVGNIHLLDYGAWYCEGKCSSYSPNSTGFIPSKIFPGKPDKEELVAAEALIIDAADRIGRAITGFPLTSTYLSDDGAQYIKIYENVVFALNKENPTRAFVLAITHSLNIRPGKPKPEIKETGAEFTQVKDQLGYTVRSYFLDFITLHGGKESSGTPIMNEYALNNSVMRQCFENVCLDYHKKAGDGLKVRPAPLGYIYRELYYREEPDQPVIVSANSNITIYPWETSALIPSDEAQEIGAAIYDNFIAVPDVEVVLRVRMPDNTWIDSDPQTTDGEGKVNFHLDPIQAPNGTIILYQVCLYGLNGSKNFCVMEDFTIWGNP